MALRGVRACLGDTKAEADRKAAIALKREYLWPLVVSRFQLQKCM